MRRKTHVKMMLLGLVGLFLTFRREIHDLARIDHEDKEEIELERLQQKYRQEVLITPQ
jgi:hypothetical protein